MAEAIHETIGETKHDLGLDYRVLVGDARERLADLPDSSVDLIITSPPYGSIKQYSDETAEIGHDMDYQEYHAALLEVFRECVRVLQPGCRMVINVGDQFMSTTKAKPYHIRPHSAQIIANMVNEYPDDMIYTGTIHWRKVTTSNTSGGGRILGSVYHPRNGHFFVNYEHIITFKKLGRSKRPSSEIKEESRFTLDQRREWFSDTWNISPTSQTDHVAMFPMEVPERLIRMYSFVGETVLDPFVGSGTTIAAAAKHDRSAIGIELGFGGDWKEVIRQKVEPHLQPSSLIYL